MDIAAWLKSLGLERYEESFVANEIDAAVLPSLTSDDLKELGVALVGHRRKLLDAIVALRANAAPDLGAPAVPVAAAERRHLTVMFVDLVGSTQMSTQLDPEDMRSILLAYQSAVAAAITRVDGNVAKYMGDGVLAYFGWPQAHEDEGERAVRAGLATVAAVAALTAPHGEALQARVGIATGLVVVGDLIGQGEAQERAVVGDTPNLAARLQSIAAPGQVVISDSTRRLLGSTFAIASLDEHELKGIVGRTRAFAVTGERALASRFAARAGDQLAALVGRRHELAQLADCWAAARHGNGQFVLLTGEAGIGKSRLAEALVAAVAAQPHHRLRCQCSPYHTDSALHPVIQQLCIASGITAADSAAQRFDKIEGHLQRGAAVLPADIALIATLVGAPAATHLTELHLSPQQQRFRTLAAIANHVIALAEQAPVLLLIEDAHWIDPSTRDLIEHCASAFATARVVVLITTRPGAAASYMNAAPFSTIHLGRLSREEVAAIARTAGGGQALPAELVDAIAARSDGVPLYVEEMARAAVESGGPELDGRVASLAIPATLQDSLMSRLDRLPAAKHVAQTAAVIGRSFDFRTLAAISTASPAQLTQALSSLAAAELVYQQGTPPDAQFLWKHGLVRDAAYESLLKSTRQGLHGKLAATLEATAGTAPELVAYHAEAGNRIDSAIRHWRLAGDAAMARPAYEEAIAHYTSAVTLASAQPQGREQELELRTQLGLASISAKGHSHADTCAVFTDALRMVAFVRRNDLAFISWYGLWCGHHVRSEIGAAQHSAKELFAAANAVGEASHRLMGLRAQAISAVMGGELAAALRGHQQALALQDPERDRNFAKVVGQDQTVSFRSYYAINLWAVGRATEAFGLAEQSIRLGKSAGHVNSLGYGFMHATLVALLARRAELRALTEEMLAFTTEHRMSMWREYGLQFAAICRLADGDAAAIDDLHAARRLLSARHARLFSSLLALEAADRLVALGKLDAAESLIEEAQQTIAETGERYAEAEVHRVRGVLQAASGSDPTAAFDAGLAVARRQGAESFAARIDASRRHR